MIIDWSSFANKGCDTVYLFREIIAYKDHLPFKDPFYPMVEILGNDLHHLYNVVVEFDTTDATQGSILRFVDEHGYYLSLGVIPPPPHPITVHV